MSENRNQNLQATSRLHRVFQVGSNITYSIGTEHIVQSNIKNLKFLNLLIYSRKKKPLQIYAVVRFIQNE